MDHAPPPKQSDLARDFAVLAETDDQTPADVHAKEQLYAALRGPGTAYMTMRIAADFWTYAFFAPLQSGKAVPTTADVRRAMSQPNAVHGLLTGAALAKSTTHPFFHWPLEFPEVFETGGFDVVLGNPPWEQVQPEEIKFFRGEGAHEIADLAGAQRKAAIKALPETNAELHRAWGRYQHAVETEAAFARASGRFPLSVVGKINTYPLFADINRGLISERGRTGFIVPTGIATDDTTKHLFGDFVSTGSLVSLFDFENRLRVFPGIDSRIKFSLLTLGGADTGRAAEFAFFLLRGTDLQDEERRLPLNAGDFALMNPNTRTCPIFRSRRDAEITRGIYERVPVLIDENDEENGNPWSVTFRQGLFNMTSDSGLFRTAPGPGLLPLYEAKAHPPVRPPLGHLRGWRSPRSHGTREGRPEPERDPALLGPGAGSRESPWRQDTGLLFDDQGYRPIN